MTGARVSVTIDEDHLDTVQQVAEELRARGLRIESVLEVLGIVTGEVEDPAVLRGVEGVRSVDTELRHDIGPPGAHVQRSGHDAVTPVTDVGMPAVDPDTPGASSDEGAQPG